MRLVRIALIAGGALVALLVLAVIALLLLVDPNRYRSDIQRIVRDKTGRELQIGGKLELKVFPWIALGIHEVSLGNPPGYGSQPFLTVKEASIGVKLFPLLAHRLQVSRVAVDTLDLNLVSRGEANNWQDLGGPADRTQPPPEAASSSAAVASIGGIDIKNSHLSMRDEQKKSTTDIAGLQLHSGPISSEPGHLSLEDVKLGGSWSSTTAGGKPPGAPLPFELQIPALVLDSAHGRLSPAKISVRVGDLRATVAVAGQATGQRQLSGTLTVDKVSPRKLMQSLGITAPVTRDHSALGAFALQTNFLVTSHRAALDDLLIALDDTQVRGSAAVEDLDSEALSFNLNVNGINLDRYRGPPPPKQSLARPAAPAAAEPPTPLPLESMRKLDAHGTLRVGTLTVSGIAFTDMALPLAARDGHIRLGPTQAHLYGGTYNGDIVLDARPVQAQLSLNEHLRGTDIGALAKAAVDSSRISGHSDANVVLNGVGNTDDALIKSLNGKIDASVKQGALEGIDVQYELQRANALIKRQIPAQHSGPEHTVFNVLRTSATLDKGVLRTDDLQIETDFLKVHGKGTLVVATEAIDYQLVAAVDRTSPRGSAAAGSLDALGGVEVPLAITGTLANPSVRPDIAALAKGQLRQEVQKKAGELVKGKLGDRLKDLLNH